MKKILVLTISLFLISGCATRQTASDLTKNGANTTDIFNIPLGEITETLKYSLSLCGYPVTVSELKSFNSITVFGKSMVDSSPVTKYAIKITAINPNTTAVQTFWNGFYEGAYNPLRYSYKTWITLNHPDVCSLREQIKLIKQAGI